MKILFLCTAHNSLSQRLYLALSKHHDVTIEYALSEELLISAVALAAPDLVICPFLTTLVPKHIYEHYMTLIVHPGPPGDVGPSALDWVLMGDDGSIDESKEALQVLDTPEVKPGRSHWGVTVLQAIEEFDAGPVWAFEQFPINIDEPGLTKSALYRGAVSQAAVAATLAAISRIQSAASKQSVTKKESELDSTALTLNNNPAASPEGTVVVTTSPTALDGVAASSSTICPSLRADPLHARLSLGENMPFKGGPLHHRPLLKAVERNFDLARHSAAQISRRIRCGDSQPGVLSTCFGTDRLYVYGGQIEDNLEQRLGVSVSGTKAKILGFRSGAICFATCDGKGIWITHIRRMKSKNDKALWPKVPATFGLLELGLITNEDIRAHDWPLPGDFKLALYRTFQEIWVEFQIDEGCRKTAYVYFDFYNGAMATDQCSRLIGALDYVLMQSTCDSPVQAVVLMGGAYFSNGIALNVIEAAADPAKESWLNINRIDDLVQYLLQEFPARGILTIAAVRGNAAAGGVALATACDVVVAGSDVVLNPAYRTVGLFGSEYHTLSYYGRCGEANARRILSSMMPMSALQAQLIGLVDHVFPSGPSMEDYIRTHVAYLLKPGCLKRGLWKKNIDTSPSALARARAYELGEMCLDFWSARAIRYNSRRFDFVRKIRCAHTPLRFALHRRALDPSRLDEEETDDFESVAHYSKLAEDKLVASLQKKLADEVSHLITQRDNEPLKQEVMHEIAGPPVVETEGKLEPVFSCYYKPHTDDLPTPPDSPLRDREVVVGTAVVD